MWALAPSAAPTTPSFARSCTPTRTTACGAAAPGATSRRPAPLLGPPPSGQATSGARRTARWILRSCPVASTTPLPANVGASFLQGCWALPSRRTTAAAAELGTWWTARPPGARTQTAAGAPLQTTSGAVTPGATSTPPAPSPRSPG